MEHSLARTLSPPSQLLIPTLRPCFPLRPPSLSFCLSHRPNICIGSRRTFTRLNTVSKATGNSALDSNMRTDLFGLYKKVLLPIIDRNPYLSEATRQAAATTTALAKRYGAEITVVVIDEYSKESINDHDLRIKNIRWHLAQGGFEEFGLLESLGEGKLPAAIIGEIADDLSLDLVVLSMESIHSKHIDGNLLPEFVPCPVMLLPL